jgi:hypothetical protein
MLDEKLGRAGRQRDRRWLRRNSGDGDSSRLRFGKKPNLEDALTRLKPCCALLTVKEAFLLRPPNAIDLNATYFKVACKVYFVARCLSEE